MKALGLLVGLCFCLCSGQRVTISRLGPKDNLNTYAIGIGENYAGNEIQRNNGIQDNFTYNSRRSFDNVNVQKGSDTTLLVNKNKSLNQGNSLKSKCDSIVDLLKDRLAQTNSIREENQHLKTLSNIIRVYILKNKLQDAPYGLVVDKIRRMLSETVPSEVASIQQINLMLEKFKDQRLNALLVEIRSRPDLSLQVVGLKLARLLYSLKQDLLNQGFSQEIVNSVIKRAVQSFVPVVGYYLEKECKVRTQMYIVRYLEAALNVNLESVQTVQHLESQDKLSLVNSKVLDNSLNSAQNWGSLKNQGLKIVAGRWNEKLVEGMGGVRNQENSSNGGNIGASSILQSVGGSSNNGFVNGVGGVVNQGNPSGTGNVGNLVDASNQGSVAGEVNVENLNNLNAQLRSGYPVNKGNQGNSGDQAGTISAGNNQELKGVKNIISQSVREPEVYKRNLEELGDLGGLNEWNEKYINGLLWVLRHRNPLRTGNLEGRANQGSLGGSGNVGNAGDHAEQISTGNTQQINSLKKLSPWGLRPVVYRSDLEIRGDLERPWNKRYVNGIGGIINQVNPSRPGDFDILKGLGGEGEPWLTGNVNDVRGVINQGNPLGIGLLEDLEGLRSVRERSNEEHGSDDQKKPSGAANLGSLGNKGNQGNIAGQENVENGNTLKTEIGAGISVNMGNQGNSGDHAGPIDTGNTQGVGF